MLDLTGALGFSQKSVRNPPQDDWNQKRYCRYQHDGLLHSSFRLVRDGVNTARDTTVDS